MVVIVFSCTGLVALFTGGESAETNTMAFLLLVLYALFRWGSGREAVIGLAIMLVGVAVPIASGRLGLADAIGAFAVMFSALALGVAFRYRAGARARELDQVKLLEREQLARDLHDTVAHHVSAMAIRAQAGLAVAATRPGGRGRSARVIEAEASRTLAEMRAMVRVLRRRPPADAGTRPPASPTSSSSPAGPAPARPSTWSSPATSTASPRRSEPRSTASPRSRSPTPGGTPATPPASRSASPPTTRRSA